MSSTINRSLRDLFPPFNRGKRGRDKKTISQNQQATEGKIDFSQDSLINGMYIFNVLNPHG
jgi:hypothetical protein